jgi:glutamate--cysteine ligase
MPSGNPLTLEPGGQVEISALPQPSLPALQATVNSDIDFLADLLSRSGLRMGTRGIDPARSPSRVLSTPRYDAMAQALARYSPFGRSMMCSTAGLQVCLDAGRPSEFAERWAALHDIGPALIALFANSRCQAGQDTGWASARMGTWFGMDPKRTAPVAVSGDPIADWVAYVLNAPILCVRRPGAQWLVPTGVSFADWINGAVRPAPTTDDLDYHISTLFPPIRPRGYFEIRYIDTQPEGEWIAPAALITTLLTPGVLDTARDICARTAGRWLDAARLGLADADLAATALALAELALDRLPGTGLPAQDRHDIHRIVDRRLAAGRPSGEATGDPIFGEMERSR